MYRKGFLIVGFAVAIFFITLNAVVLATVSDYSVLSVEEEVIKTSKAVKFCNSIPKNILVKNDYHFPSITDKKERAYVKPSVISEEDVRVVGKNSGRVEIINKEVPNNKAWILHDADKKNHYMPYLQVGGNIFIKGTDTASSGLDLFIPILQWGLTDLIFTDLRVYDRSGHAFEGNLHLGYRHLFSESQQMLGIFGAFDRRKTHTGNYFNQLMIGAEYWLKRLFIGANVYGPVGKLDRFLGVNEQKKEDPLSKNNYRSVTLTKDKVYEKAIAGFDAEVGYELIDGLVGYAGGYYFNANRVDGVYGPKARLTYDLTLDSRNVFKIFNKVGLEAGVQHDKQRGTVWHFGINVRMGLWPERANALEGVARHMVDPVRRDVDIIVSELSEEIGRSKSVRIREVKSAEEFYEALKDAAVDIIDIGFDFKEVDDSELREIKNMRRKGQRKSSQIIVFDDKFGNENIAKFLEYNPASENLVLNLNDRVDVGKKVLYFLERDDFRFISKKNVPYKEELAKLSCDEWANNKLLRGGIIRCCDPSKNCRMSCCSPPKDNGPGVMDEFTEDGRSGGSSFSRSQL